MNCAICNEPIPAARLVAMPLTRLCITCKRGNDEPKLGVFSPLVMRAMAEGSLSDPEEMQRAARDMVGR